MLEGYSNVRGWVRLVLQGRYHCPRGLNLCAT